MTQTRPRSTWLGPNRAYYQQADWPAPCQLHLRFHDMIPGDLWNDPDGILLMQPHILQPTGLWNHWRKLGPPWFYQYKQRLEETRLLCTAYAPWHHTFWLIIPTGVSTFFYNSITSPTGVFAYGGSATLAWEDL